MRFEFTNIDADAVTAKLMEALGGRELGKIVSIERLGDQLEVNINKLGQSKLLFAITNNSNKVIFDLKSEKIAFTHKMFKDEVKSKIAAVIENIGGKILQA